MNTPEERRDEFAADNEHWNDNVREKIDDMDRLADPGDREELIRKAMQALRSTGIELALRTRAEVVLRAVGAIE